MQFFPVNAYWTGPYAAGGSAFGGGHDRLHEDAQHARRRG